MTEFRDQLKEVQTLGLQGAQEIVLDLAVVAVDKEYNLTGNFFYVKEAPDQTSYIQVRVNRSSQAPISWMKQTGFIGPFSKLYITTPAGQAGLMRVLIAAESPTYFDIIDNRSAVSESMNNVLDELRGDVLPENWGTEKTIGIAAAIVLAANVNRKACIVQSKAINTGLVYLGFDNTVTSSKWVAELQPGMAFPIDDYRGPIYAIASAAGQLVGYGEW
jgi:hypothetical protein